MHIVFRTTMLSLAAGLTRFGSIPSYALGGLITTRTKNNLTVFYISVFINIINIVYVYTVVPESFTEERRILLEQKKAAERRNVEYDRPTGIRQWIRSLFSTLVHPLVFLSPKLDPDTKKWNTRRFWCGVHFFLGQLGGGYAFIALLVYLTTYNGYKPDDVSFTRLQLFDDPNDLEINRMAIFSQSLILLRLRHSH